MPLTPADVHNVVFKKPPIGKRGYDEDEVDPIPRPPAGVQTVVLKNPPIGRGGYDEDGADPSLDVGEAEPARLIEENNALRAGTGRSGARTEERPEPTPSPVPTPSPMPV